MANSKHNERNFKVLVNHDITPIVMSNFIQSLAWVEGGDDRRCVLRGGWSSQTEHYACAADILDGHHDDEHMPKAPDASRRPH